MNIAVWIVQGLSGFVFLMAGAMKWMRTREQLIENNMGWAEDFSQNQVRLIGLAEILGALGLILPAATGIAPILTPLAAVGLALIQAGAFGTHSRRGEGQMQRMNIVLIVLLLFVAFGRFFIVPL